jgi:hypothetical protein
MPETPPDPSAGIRLSPSGSPEILHTADFPDLIFYPGQTERAVFPGPFLFYIQNVF